MRDIKAKRTRGFTLGELLVVFVVSASLVAVFFPVMRAVRQRYMQVECANNVKKIGIALYMYANRNDGRFPESLEKLYLENYLSDESIMNCPATRKEGTVKNPDYAYVGELCLKTSENKPMLLDKENNHAGGWKNVLYLDGTVEWEQ